MTLSPLDARRFRDVIGHYPTGVVVVTGIDSSGEPAGMVIGSFTSASLDPPMVLFLPMKSSRTFARLQTAPSYCINVLSADQEDLCRQLTGRGKRGNGFDGVSWRPAPSGAPVIEGAVAWIDCTQQTLVDCGDHYIAVCAVRDLGVESAGLPLLFFQSDYGRFARRSVLLSAVPDLIPSVRAAQLIEPHAAQVAADLNAECSVLAPIGGDAVFIASAAGRDARPQSVGTHTPIFPPLAPLFVGAPGSPDEDEWLALLGKSAPDVVADAARRLARVRERGWSLMLHSAEHSRAELDRAVADYMAPNCTPADERRLLSLIREMIPCHEPENLCDDERYDVLRISVPVRDEEGQVVLALRLAELPRDATGEQVRQWRERLQQAAGDASAALAAD